MVDHKFPINKKNYFRYIMEILSSYTDGFCRLCDRIAKKSKSTRISGRYAPLILAPAEGSTLEPCPLDYSLLFYNRIIQLVINLINLG